MTASQIEQPGQLGHSDLCRIEHALLAALLDVQSDRSNAVDDLLNDFGARGHGHREQAEQLLAAAVLDTHPDRNKALDKMLADISRAPAA